MKISINSTENLSQLSSPSLDGDRNHSALIEKIGAQLGGIDEVIAFGDKYEGIVIVKIVSCVKHAQADRLNICMIDDGGKAENVERSPEGLVQVVCGAPNVRDGLTVAWLPPGSTVPDSVGKEPFVLGKRELRGVVSNGMLASPKELALGDSHDGILEISEEITPGTTFVDAYHLQGDTVLDIENKMFTHRPDCFGFMGVAREIAGIQGLSFTSPEWYRTRPELPGLETDELPLAITNDIPELVPRFAAIVMSDVQVSPSPTWLQVELAKVGSRSINNIVDYTNYFMLLTGQPLHAYDYDKVAALSNESAHIVIRQPHPGESLNLLNGKSVEPRAEAIVIATDKQSIGVGGVMGGADTEVDSNTTRIILECATFDMYSIRRTAMAHGLFTDAVTRFNKGQSPLQNLAVLGRIVSEIREHAGGKVAHALIDDSHISPEVMDRTALFAPVNVSATFINERLGLALGPQEMQSLLENVEFQVSVHGDELTVQAPFWRTDIEFKEDIVEEVGRLYGFDKLPLALPQRSINPAARNELLDLKTRLRKILSKAGANELLTYSFVPESLMQKVKQNPQDAFKISNALSPDLQYYRLSILPSLMNTVHSNSKAGHPKFALYEIGKTHTLDQIDEDGLPEEAERLGVLIAADRKVSKNLAGAPYYYARHYVVDVLASLGHNHAVTFETLTKDLRDAQSAFMADGRSAVIKLRGVIVGYVGEIQASVRNDVKLPDFCAGFEIDLRKLRQQSAVAAYVPKSRFPTITQDFTLEIPNGIAFADVFSAVQQHLDAKELPETNYILSPADIFQKVDDPEFKQVTIRLEIGSTERTLTDKEVSILITDIVSATVEQFGAARA